MRLPIVICAILLSAAPAVTQPRACGSSPNDWCPAPAGDACGRHANVAACRADPACFGIAYRGLSNTPCQAGPRGFSPNCATVGCSGTPNR